MRFVHRTDHQCCDFYFLFFSRWDNALPAADLESLPVLLSRNTLDAFEATFLLVTFLAIVLNAPYETR